MISTTLRQWFCAHNARKTTFAIHDECVVSKTVCTDCGKGVAPHDVAATRQLGFELLFRNRSEEAA